MEIREILPWDKPHFCRMAHDFYRLPAVAHAIPDSHAERTFDLLMGDTPYARVLPVRYHVVKRGRRPVRLAG